MAEERTMSRVLTIAVLSGALLGCGSSAAQVDSAPSPSPQASSSPVPQSQSANFDSNLAWEHLRQMVAIGPRPAGSEALRQTRAYITRQMSAAGLKVEEQPFVAQTPVGNVNMVNLIVRLPGRRTDRILITGHYDTKPIKEFMFVGASDGASSAAMLIEIARVLKGMPH